MLRKELKARQYQARKAFVFRGLQYNTGDVFDPVKAYCPPHKLDILIRQRYLCDVGPVLADVLRNAPAPTPTQESPGESISEPKITKDDAVEGADDKDVEEAPKPKRRRRV